jgi:acetyltransferase-like isoleucine patch superfamily enzyme
MNFISTLNRRLLKWMSAFIEWFIIDFPNPLGQVLRYIYWKQRLARLGNNCKFGYGIRIHHPELVEIGDNCRIDDHVLISAGRIPGHAPYVFRQTDQVDDRVKEGEIRIGDRVGINAFALLQGYGGLWIGSDLEIASGARIISVSHHYQDLTGKAPSGELFYFSGKSPLQQQTLLCLPVIIEDGAAVGLNSVVLPGSHIGKNAWLGALSLLKGDLPDNTVAFGSPAKVIKKRDITI